MSSPTSFRNVNDNNCLHCCHRTTKIEPGVRVYQCSKHNFTICSHDVLIFGEHNTELVSALRDYVCDDFKSWKQKNEEKSNL